MNKNNILYILVMYCIVECTPVHVLNRKPDLTMPPVPCTGYCLT